MSVLSVVAQSARTGIISCRRISCTFHRKQWREVISTCSYVSILNLGMFGLSIYKLVSFDDLIVFTWPDNETSLFSYASVLQLFRGTCFVTTLFYFIFLFRCSLFFVRKIMRTMSQGLVFVIIITDNFIYLLSGLCSCRLWDGLLKHSCLVSLFITLVNLGTGALVMEEPGRP